jgi:hypothetical protein
MKNALAYYNVQAGFHTLPVATKARLFVYMCSNWKCFNLQNNLAFWIPGIGFLVTASGAEKHFISTQN